MSYASVANMTIQLHEMGLCEEGHQSYDKQIPHWEKFLDKEYESKDASGYGYDIVFLKELGYKIFRNGEGKHRMKYEGDTE